MFIQFRNLRRPGVVHFQTDRQGGVSQNEYCSMNMGYSAGDAYANVMANRSALARTLGIGLERFVFCRQVHGAHVHIVTAADSGRGVDLLRHDTIQDTDALVTNVPGLMLCIKTADCIPLFMYDPCKRCVGIAHVGWRGAAKNLPVGIVRTLQEHYHSDPSDLIVVLGVGIGGCCYQAAESIYRLFHDEVTPNSRGPYPIDLKSIIAKQLLAAGVPGEQVEISRICSACNHDRHFSARATGGKCGYSLSGIGLL